jgi:UDP-glucose 4-epimerase
MLRYFNVSGCDRAGLIGEHHEPETHIIPIICQVALGQRDKLSIFGDDYATPDGTCVRDYIHVEDLVEAHIAALDALEPGDCRTYNLGLGRGISILEIVEAVRRVSGKDIPIEMAPSHPGDPPTLFCDASKIARELDWKPQITDLDEIISTAWQWFHSNPILMAISYSHWTTQSTEIIGRNDEKKSWTGSILQQNSVPFVVSPL